MKNTDVLLRINWGCKAPMVALLVLLIALPQTIFAQHRAHQHYNRTVTVERSGASFYETTTQMPGKTLENIAQDLNVNLDTLRKYNPHIRTGVIGVNVSIYYPEHLLNLHQIPQPPAQQLQTFTVVKGNQISTRESSIEDFRLNLGENFAYISSRDNLIKSDTLRWINHKGKTSEYRKVTIPALYLVRVKVGEETELRDGYIDFFTLPIMQFERNQNLYSGDYLIRYTTNDSHKQEIILDGLELRLQSTKASFFPEPIKIDKTNTTYDISISDGSFDNPIPVNIIAPDSSYNYEVEKEPVIRIETKPRNLEGYGIEEISVLVRLLAYTGDDSLKIDIETTKGSVDPSGFYLSTKSKAFKLRSSGIGTAIVEVKSSEGYDSKEFKFNFPSMFLIFSLIGGLVGSLIKYLMKHKEYNLGITLLSGCLTGVFVTLLWWILGITSFVGLRLPSGVLNEGLVLLVAILGALYWEKAYSSLSALLFHKKP